MEQKNFEFFLFENFDASEILTENNPRTYLNHSITGILSDVVNAVPLLVGIRICAVNIHLNA